MEWLNLETVLVVVYWPCPSIMRKVVTESENHVIALVEMIRLAVLVVLHHFFFLQWPAKVPKWWPAKSVFPIEKIGRDE